MDQQLKSNTSMTNTVLEHLRNDIINCVYSAGQFITEVEISKKFNVSKTPAREALNYLCQEGLLDKIPRKGYVIKSLSFAELQYLCQFRSILERGAVEWAIRFASDAELEHIEELAHRKINIDDEDFFNRYNDINICFHLGIAQLSKNPYLISALQNVLNMLRRNLVIDVRSNLEKSLESHIIIADCLKRRDLDQALRITSDQIEMVEKRLYLQ